MGLASCLGLSSLTTHSSDWWKALFTAPVGQPRGLGIGLDFLLIPSPVPPSPSKQYGLQYAKPSWPVTSIIFYKAFPAREHHSHLIEEESSATDIKNLFKVIQLLVGGARI